jgi:outer membrane receptor for ferrienterochelin and colicin
MRILPLLALFLGVAARGQTPLPEIRGRVTDAETGLALPGANVFWLGSTSGTSADLEGYFALGMPAQEAPIGERLLIISQVGYQSDTLALSNPLALEVSLLPGQVLSTVSVEARQDAASLLTPINQVTISEHELTRGACCNLSESFETTTDVDVEFTDGISGARQVRMLGLDGRYVQLQTENRPGIRGMALPYGLTFIPGTWMSSIQVTKGPGSVVNGYESMSGQINVEYHKPETADKLFLNAYGSIMGRLEANAHGKAKISPLTTMGWFAHGAWVGRQNDHNEDNFLDMPESESFVLMNRWSFTGRRAVHGQAGAEYAHQDLYAGQRNSRDADINAVYSNPISTRRAQAWTKVGWIHPDKERRSTGLIVQGTWHQQESRYGNRYAYAGESKTLHANLINDVPLGSGESHLLRTGASLLLDDVTESLSDPTASNETFSGQLRERMEAVPGGFAEYAFERSDWSVVAGARLDYHNTLGWRGAPRVHLRKCWNNKTTLRVSGGRGWRTVNPILEFSQWLNSSRQFMADEGLLWESSWNSGGSFQQAFALGERDWSLRLDYFYTAFEERVVLDLDSDAGIAIVQQSPSFSRSHAGQVELDGQVWKGMTLRMAWKYEDVRAETAGELRRETFVPRWRALASLGYETPDEHWQADATLQLVGPSRLPLGFADSESPVFPQLLAQVTRHFGAWSVYAGSENITGFHQHDAIRGASNPFGTNFDAAGLWGPVMGRNVYAGVRFTLNG